MMRILKKIKMIILKFKYWIKNKNINISINSNIIKTKLDISNNGYFNLGKKSIINSGNNIRVRNNAKLTIGNNTGINSNVIITCREKIIIGNNVLIGPNTMIFDNDHDYNSTDWHNKYKTEPIIIEDDVWVGCGAIILKGSYIKKGAIIAAGAIVKGTVEENELYICKQNVKRIKIR